MRPFFSLVLILVISAMNAYSQTPPNYLNEDKGFELSYPDSLAPVTLNDNENIKEQVEPFVIQIYDLTQSQMAAIPDKCYQFKEIYKTKSNIEFKKYICSESTAGAVYDSYIFLIEKDSYNLVLKFLHSHNEERAFNEALDTNWITKIVESVTFR